MVKVWHLSPATNFRLQYLYLLIPRKIQYHLQNAGLFSFQHQFSVISRVVRGRRIEVWAGFSQGSADFPYQNFIPPLSPSSYPFYSFHFIYPCGGMTTAWSAEILLQARTHRDRGFVSYHPSTRPRRQKRIRDYYYYYYYYYYHHYYRITVYLGHLRSHIIWPT